MTSSSVGASAGMGMGVRVGGRRASYAPFGISDDAARFGLETSVVQTLAGPVTVRHGRRSAGAHSPVALLLLHGAAGSWSTFTPLIQAADERAAAGAGAAFEDLVIPDLPGWGDSALAADRADQSIEATAAAVEEVARSLGYEQWMIVGHSLGGFVALELASAAPAAARRVLLISPTTFAVIDSVRHPVRSLRVLPAYVGMLMVMRSLVRLGSAGVGLVRAMGGSALFRFAMSPLFARAGRLDRSVYRALAAEARPVSFAIASARAGEYDASAWAGIRCPVRSLSGSADVFVAASDEVRLAAAIPDFAAGVVADAGHFGHVERPFEVLERLFG